MIRLFYLDRVVTCEQRFEVHPIPASVSTQNAILATNPPAQREELVSQGSFRNRGTVPRSTS
jgi:hypothetical protein